MNIIFRVDASRIIGGGHVMRCLTLAERLAARGASTTFVAAQLTDSLRERIEQAGHQLELIEPAILPAGPDWDVRPWEAAAQRFDADQLAERLGNTPTDWLIVDHYGLAEAWERRLRARARRIAVIDDLANRQHDCDLLLDQTAGRKASDYRPLVASGCRILAGAFYSLLRAEFVDERPAALRRHREPGELRRLLISLGSTDVGGITAAALHAVLEAGCDCAIDVVHGAEAPSLAEIRRLSLTDARIEPHIDSDDIASLMQRADLAIGAGGTSSWERCALGLPTLMLVLSNNQRALAERLAASGAADLVSEVNAVGAALSALAPDRERRAAMAAAAAAMTDGLGASRVADALFDAPTATAAEIAIRAATAEDSERIWLWRNDPETRAISRTTQPIAWTDHRRWYDRCLTSPDCHLYVAYSHDQPFAAIRFDIDGVGDDASAHVSINLAPHRRGSGLGAAALSAACDHFKRLARARAIVAIIKDDNLASRRLFEGQGFRRAKQVEATAFSRYEAPAT